VHPHILCKHKLLFCIAINRLTALELEDRFGKDLYELKDLTQSTFWKKSFASWFQEQWVLRLCLYCALGA